MGKYAVPESIRQMKPKGTMVKCISGHYYVYEYSTVTGPDGKRRTEMGKAIGSIREGIGFIPNNNFACDTEITSLEFGEYAITLANSGETLSLLRECFNPEDAARIYSVAIIHFVHGFTYLKDIKDYYDMSILSLRFPGLKMGYESLTNLYDTLGRRQTNVLKMEQKLVDRSSKQAAIDGHVIGCESDENDLAEKGYKFRKIGEAQENLLMAYDINTGIPLLSRIYEGASNDKVSVKDFIDQVEMKDMLFIIDRGFYSSDNINLFSSNGNEYIIPLGKSQTGCKRAVHSLEMHDRFLYQKGKKASVVEYKDEIIALRIIYDQAYKDRPMMIDGLKAMYQKLKEKGVTVERLWDCYAIKKPEKVKHGTMAQLTDLISIIRFEMGYTDNLSPFADKVNYNFMQWTFRKNTGAVHFTEEQMEWLRMIKDHIITSLSILPEDLDLTPFDRRGGLAAFYGVFGDEYENILNEMNIELVA